MGYYGGKRSGNAKRLPKKQRARRPERRPRTKRR